jgi:hypothetical protein
VKLGLRGPEDCRSLGLPNFLLILAALIECLRFSPTENRTRGCISEQRGRKLGCAPTARRGRRDDKVEAGDLPEDFVSGIEGLIAPTSLFLSSKIQGLHDVWIIRVKLERFLKFLLALVEISVVAQSQAEVFVQPCSQLAILARSEGFFQ